MEHRTAGLLISSLHWYPLENLHSMQETFDLQFPPLHIQREGCGGWNLSPNSISSQGAPKNWTHDLYINGRHCREKLYLKCCVHILVVLFPLPVSSKNHTQYLQINGKYPAHLIHLQKNINICIQAAYTSKFKFKLLCFGLLRYHNQQYTPV